jgi:membrane protease YdiL (CAAX protease family)
MNSNIIPDDKKPLLQGWIRALLIIIPFLIFTIAFQFIGHSFSRLYSPIDYLDKITIIQVFELAGTLLLVFIFTRYLDRTNLENLGFQLKGYTNSIFLGIVAGALLISSGFIIIFALNEIIVTGTDFDIAKLSTSIVLYALVALNEEIFTRGYILNNFLQSMNRYVALALSSLIFSLLHFFNPDFSWISFASIFLAGMMLGISYIYTKNLWFPIALHFSWNFFQGTVFGFNVSGVSIYSIINQHPVENNILNGGNFGFEGSIVSQIFIVIAIFVIWLSTKR